MVSLRQATTLIRWFFVVIYFTGNIELFEQSIEIQLKLLSSM